MTRLSAWRQHAACRKQIVSLKKRADRAERALLKMRKQAKRGKA